MANKKITAVVGEGSSPRIARASILWMSALLPIVFNPTGFNLYAPVRSWFLYTATTAIATLFIYHLLFSSHAQWRRQIIVENTFLFFTFALVTSTLLSFHSYSSLYGNFSRYEGFFAWISYLVLFFITYHLFIEKKDIERLFKYLTFSAIAISLYAIAQHYGIDIIKWQEGLVTDRVFSTLGNPAYLGAYLALLLPLTIRMAFLSTDQKKISGIRYAIASLLMFAALIFTSTRGAWIAVFISLFIMLFLLGPRLINKASLKRYLLILSAVVLLLTMITLTTNVMSPYTSRITALVKNEGSVGGRLLIWKQVLPLIGEHPLFGSGPDTLFITFSTKITPEYERRVVRDTATDRAHNDFLHMAATMGLIGLAGYLSLIGTLFYLMAKARKKATGFWQAAIEGIALSMFSYLIMLQTHFSTIDVSPIFWILAGLGLSASIKHLNPQKEKPVMSRKNRFMSLKPVIVAAQLVVIVIVSWLSFKPVLADYDFKQAKAAAVNKMPSLALEYYRSAADLQGGHDHYLRELSKAYIETAPQVKDAQLFSDAIEVSKEAVEFSPANIYNHFSLGNAYLAAYEYSGDKNELSKAIRAYKKGRDIDSNYAEMRLKLGVAYAYINKSDLALREWRKVITLSPGAISVRYNIGNMYKQLGDTNAANQYYKQILSIDPKQDQAKQLLKEGSL